MRVEVARGTSTGPFEAWEHLTSRHVSACFYRDRPEGFHVTCLRRALQRDETMDAVADVPVGESIAIWLEFGGSPGVELQVPVARQGNWCGKMTR
jgi:hypothetical protein